MDEDDDWKLDGALVTVVIELIEVIRRLCELQKKCRSKRKKVPKSVLKAFTLASEQLNSVKAYLSMAEHAGQLDLMEELKIIFKNMAVE